ncbi:MAG: long-chain-fatty-acid--CoA ligase [Acidimicrobiia bacterium]|nr:long-chain-fatty-acid--CoA ligase [Acidimicrobiia bacterium]
MFVPLTPLRFLHRAMDLFGHRVGIINGDKQFTYGQFGERCQKLASGLAALGVQSGDRVAYISFNNHQLLEGYYGVIQARGIVMPLNVRLSPPELISIINHSGAKVLLFENDFVPLIDALKPHCKAVGKWVTIDDKVPQADLTYEEIIAQGKSEKADIFSYEEMSIAELFYTSGSTGTPKGVTLSHRTLYLHCLDVLSIFKDVDTMVDLHTIPLFHANGWGRPQSSVLLGIKQVMVRRFEPGFVFRMIREHKATHMSLVPTMANAMLNSPEISQTDLSSLRQVMVGGAAASPELIQRMETAFGCEVVSGYGLTETAPVLTTARQKPTVTYTDEAERYRRHSMAGWAVPGVEVRVVDHEMNDVPRDMTAIGEVVARGDHVMDGYFKEPEQTASVMTNGWFHTGDMAIWDEEGYIHIVDRKKEIIISGGENISSIEVEKAIFAHPAVFECAVVAAPDEKWGEVPAAIVVLKPDQELTEAELLEFLQQRLGKFKLPRLIEFHADQLPKTGTGKIRKLVLKEKFWSGKEKRVQG